jgi:hypothetical protein
MREAHVEGSVAGEEIRLEPRNQTSVRFKFGAMVKMPELVENIPQAEVKIKCDLTGSRVYITK